MAKRTKAAGLELKAVRRRVNDVEAALAKVRDEYALGRRSLEETNGGRVPYGSMRDLDNGGVSSELLRKARALAGDDGYTSSELDDLIRECDRAEFAIGVSHLYRLCAVPKGKRRETIQRRAIQGRWSRRRLDSEIGRLFGNRRKLAGRHVQPPSTGAETIYRLRRQCRSLASLLAAIPVHELSASFHRSTAAFEVELNRFIKKIDKASR